MLTNFRLWLFTPLETQLHLFNVILYEIRANVTRFRSKEVLGVPRLLAALRLYYWIEPPDLCVACTGGPTYTRMKKLVMTSKLKG